ncbi:hypothetical protein B0H21DRAFT_818261 [Amylocystis lapponica]|nr:hypothetical protein B0H21DRAFT_818261 [Amylocystis lapponica]
MQKLVSNPRKRARIDSESSDESGSSSSSVASSPVLRATCKIPTPITRSATPDDLPERSTTQSASDELQLLGDATTEHVREDGHELKNAPILTRDAYVAAAVSARPSQYGVLGSLLSIHNKVTRDVPNDPRLYINTNTPFSALVCGVQGSGKSHTVSVLLESMFIPGYTAIGYTEKALSGLILHFGEGGPDSRPSEVAWLARAKTSGIRVPKAVYAPLGDQVTVSPLLFSENELDAEAILSLMAVGSSESAPLYMQTATLRDLGEKFTYAEFVRRLEACKGDWNPAQVARFTQRMALVKAFVDTSGPRRTSVRFAEGQVTIVDLTDKFIDPASACGLFEIVTRIFVRADVGTGKVLVVDEAHKYLSANRIDSGLTKALLSLIRQQRHMAMRVVISTQEPTVVPAVLLDLCGIVILHRFSSPSWWDHVARHVSADLSDSDAFDRIVRLRTGHAIVLAPSGLDIRRSTSANKLDFPDKHEFAQFGRQYLLVKTRERITEDGGASILVIDG